MTQSAAEKLPINVLDESDGAEDSCGAGTSVIGLEVDILGETVNFRISTGQQQARLADMVPAARILSSRLVAAFCDKLHKQKKFVPCRKGCSACCSYLVPLSVPEAFRISEELLAMTTDRGTYMLHSCLGAAKRILDSRRDRPDLYLSATAGDQHTSEVSKWYANLKLPCPFLSDGVCTIYERRPVACREHIAVDSELLCKTEWMEEAQVVKPPVSVLEALGLLAGELEATAVEGVILPLALPWARVNLERNQRTWPAAVMVERFVDILNGMASKSAATAIAPTLPHEVRSWSTGTKSKQAKAAELH